MGYRGKFCIVICFAAALLSGCYSTENITLRSEMNDLDEDDEVTVFTKDSITYEFSKFAVSDSLISGDAEVETLEGTDTVKAAIPFSNITYIHTENFNPFKTFLYTAAFTFIGITAISTLRADDEGLKIVPEFYHEPMNSCPYLYYKDKNRYILFGEAFGIGFGKALELKTCSVIPEMPRQKSNISIRIKNERPETHFINSVELSAVETDTGSTVLASSGNRLWALNKFLEPCRAKDKQGKNIQNLISKKDGAFWSSDTLINPTQSGYKDEILLSFYPYNKRFNALSVTSINTQLIFGIFNKIFRFTREQTLRFMHAAETDTSLIKSLREWIHEGSVKAYAFNGKEWKYAGIINPEATTVPFTRLIKFDSGEINSDTLLVRLEFMKGTFEIDNISLASAADEPLKPTTAEMISSVDFTGKNNAHKISRADNNYQLLLPGDYTEILFKPVLASEGKKIVYALNVQGYLYEWFKSEKIRALPAFYGNFDRVALIKQLIKDKKLLLPFIYNSEEIK